MTDSEIIEAVAVKVMGWVRMYTPPGPVWVGDSGRTIIDATEWHPLENIADAWMVVVKLCQMVGNNGDYYDVCLSINKAETLCVIGELQDWRVEARADSAPRAICLAALRACGIEAS